MPSTARARESCTTDSTTAPAVSATTATPAGAAPITPWTGYPANTATCSRAIPPPCRLSPYTGRFRRWTHPITSSTAAPAATAARRVSMDDASRSRPAASVNSVPAPTSETSTPILASQLPPVSQRMSRSVSRSPSIPENVATSAAGLSGCGPGSGPAAGTEAAGTPGAAGARYPITKSSTPVPMNETARPGAVKLLRSTANSLTRTTAIHPPPHTQTARRPDRAPATIAARTISVHRIVSDDWKAVESISASASHRTSHQWWTVRANSMVASATPPAAAGSAHTGGPWPPAATASTGGPSPPAGSSRPERAAATHTDPTHTSAASSTISGFSSGTYGRGDGSPADTTQATPTTTPTNSSAGPAQADT